MNNKLIITVLLALILTFAIQIKVTAVSAYPFAIEHIQPDGTVVTIKMKGDEKVRWAETLDGYSLLRNKKGAWEYGTLDKKGDLICSGILAKEIDKRTKSEISILQQTPKSLRYSKSQINILKQAVNLKSAQIQSAQASSAYPVSGTINNLMILIGFSDKAFSKTQSDFDNLMNQINYNGTGSFKDFHLENSYGSLIINTTVVGAYTAANNMAYYGTNDPSDDYNVGELVEEAVTLADVDVDFADFDNNDDGVVDGVYIIYAGYGEDSDGGDTAIWAHASSIPELMLDGVSVRRYACSSELRGNSGTNINGIGVICHEFGHSLGAPDYYDTDYDTNGQYPGNGSWDVMAGGSWNNNGDTPPHHNPYTKINYYNWATATLINAEQTVTLNDATLNADFVQVNTKTANEYFLFENRQLTGFNNEMQGHGMLIYHVDGDYINDHNSTNDINSGAHQGMYVVSAAATNGSGVIEEGDVDTDDCPWPGTGSKTTFDDYTTPNSLSWAGEKTEKPITNIAENAGVITFDINFENLSNFVAAGSSMSQIDLSWDLNSYDEPVLIAFNTSNTFGNPVDETEYTAGEPIAGGGTVIYNGTNTVFNHTSLSPSTTYYYKAWSVYTDNYYSEGIETNTNTLCAPSTLPYSETFEGTTIPVCWSQVDYEGNGQIWEFGTTGSFGGNDIALTGGNYAYLNSDAYGAGNTQNADLISPTIDLSGFTDINLQFNHFHQYWASIGDSATLSYSLDNGTNWTTIQVWRTSTDNPEAFDEIIPALNDQSQVKLKWNYTATFGGGWAIDDISITGTSSVPVDYTVPDGTTVSTGETECYDAQNEITVAGIGTSVVFENGSAVTLIAGESIRFLPGFHAEQGSAMQAYITANQSFCANLNDAPIVAQTVFNSKVQEPIDQKEDIEEIDQFIKVYPNPNNGRFNIELINYKGLSNVSIKNILGATVYRSSTTDKSITDIDLTHLQRGIYFVNVSNGENVQSNKFIVQ